MRLAVVCDLLEENWPSMDLVAGSLVQNLSSQHPTKIHVVKVCPTMRKRASQVIGLGEKRLAYNADRLLNRFWDYPHWLKKKRDEFDLFHIVDHSYAHLVHDLPPTQTIVTCHDLDTFRCLLEPACEPRTWLFKLMAGRILDGLRRAAKVVCDSVATHDQLLAHELIAPERLAIVPLGVHPSCSADALPGADEVAAKLLGPVSRQAVELLHVGSTIPRKRIDVLLRVFAEVRRKFPQAVLVRVGGSFTEVQMKLAQELDLVEAVKVMPFLDREVLAALYRRAALVLQPSEAEGFGLPVAEAMACGTMVVASDLPVLREVGGEVAAYCKVGEVPQWSETVCSLLIERTQQPERWAERHLAALAQAAKFSWAEYTRRMVDIYHEVLAANG